MHSWQACMNQCVNGHVVCFNHCDLGPWFFLPSLFPQLPSPLHQILSAFLGDEVVLNLNPECFWPDEERTIYDGIEWEERVIPSKQCPCCSCETPDQSDVLFYLLNRERLAIDDVAAQMEALVKEKGSYSRFINSLKREYVDEPSYGTIVCTICGFNANTGEISRGFSLYRCSEQGHAFCYHHYIGRKLPFNTDTPVGSKHCAACTCRNPTKRDIIVYLLDKAKVSLADVHLMMRKDRQKYKDYKEFVSACAHGQCMTPARTENVDGWNRKSEYEYWGSSLQSSDNGPEAEQPIRQQMRQQIDHDYSSDAASDEGSSDDY